MATPSRQATSLASLGALALVPLGQVHGFFGTVGATVALVALILAARNGEWSTVRLDLLTLLLWVVGAARVPFGIWVVIGLMWFASRWLLVLTPDSGWLPPGQTTAKAWGLVGLVVIGSGVGLVLWARWTPEFGESTLVLTEAIRGQPSIILALAALSFAVVNGMTEEIAYRGIAFEMAAKGLSPAVAVIAQAIAFGTLHIAGFPAGPAGVVLAATYGLAIGTIRHITGGLLLPVIAHALADLVIAVFVIAWLGPT